MTRRERRQAQQTGAIYVEDRCAIRWPYYFHMVLWGTLLGVFIAAEVAIDDPDLSVPVTLSFFGVVLTLSFALKNWPVGIRVGGDGIRIGAVRRRPDPPGNQPWADYQRWHTMFAPWDTVRRIAVITDRPSLRNARLLRGRDINRVGVLTTPFTRAALLIEIDPDRAVVPDFHEPHDKLPLWRLGHLTPFEASPVWYVPTRRPAQLRAALTQYAAFIGGTSSPRLPAHLRLLLERGDVTRPPLRTVDFPGAPP